MPAKPLVGVPEHAVRSSARRFGRLPGKCYGDRERIHERWVGLFPRQRAAANGWGVEDCG